MDVPSQEEHPLPAEATFNPAVKHVAGQRPIMEILNDLFNEIDNHPDAKLLHLVRGKPPRLLPSGGGKEENSEGFPDTPRHAQHTLELRLCYRDTVTMQAREVIEPVDKRTSFEAKWGNLVKANSAQARSEAAQRAAAMQGRPVEQAQGQPHSNWAHLIPPNPTAPQPVDQPAETAPSGG
jgi:hypothetical protein